MKRKAFKCPSCGEVTRYYKPGTLCPYCGKTKMQLWRAHAVYYPIEHVQLDVKIERRDGDNPDDYLK